MDGHSEPIRWPDARRGPWQIVPWFKELADGRAICVDIRVHWIGREEPQEVTSTLMRSIPFGTVIGDYRRARALSEAQAAQAQTWVREYNSSKRAGKRPRPVMDLTPAPSLVKAIERRLQGQVGKPGRPPVRSTNFYAKVAQIYSEAYQRSEAPTKAVSQAHKELGVSLSPAAAAKAVRRARSLGFLHPTERGKAGGAIRPRRRNEKSS